MTSTLPPFTWDTAPDGPPPRHRRRRRRGRWIALVAAVVLSWPLISYARALTYPGDASVAVRTVEWVRDNGGGGLVDLVENWWYRHPTVSSTPDPASLPRPAVTTPAVTGPARLAVFAGAPALPGEGVWTAGAAAKDGSVAIYTSFERPDAQYPGVVAGVALIERNLTRTTLITGTRQPDRSTRARDAEVPLTDRPSLVATFNSGFKMGDAHGGFYLNGRTTVPLRDGAASLVVRRDGSVNIGQWGRDAVAGPDIVAVRQNLDLIVDAGQPVAGLEANAGGTWGTTRNQLQYTWRSGVGVDGTGNLLYVAGGNMTLQTLATALTDAGAVRAMQLDIHSRMVDLYTYDHHGTGLTATKLLPDMPNATDRYLVPDQRDFFAVTLR